MKYLKLGPKASSFFDPNTQVLIRGNEVVAFERLPQSKKLTVALAQGHVNRATQEEYELYTSGKAPAKDVKVEKVVAPPDEDPRLEMSADDFEAYIEKSGFLKKDQKLIKSARTRAEAIALYDQIDKKYE
jgi:hypothetical protein